MNHHDEKVLLVKLTDEQRAEMAPLFAGIRKAEGDAIMAQVYPDGMRVRVIPAAAVSRIYEAIHGTTDGMGLRSTAFGQPVSKKTPLTMPEILAKAVYVEVRAEVRYWDDSVLNGEHDVTLAEGPKMPLREGALWCPIIRLEDGNIVRWPAGNRASIHYKVCDQGEYWLLDKRMNRLAKWRGSYVPTSILNQRDGDSDYIIMRIDSSGTNPNWKRPELQSEDWISVG